MKRDKIGVVIILLGILILFYKNEGFYSFGGYVDKSWENVIISLIMIIVGVLIIKTKK